MPVIAYLRASKDGMPQWTEDCVCEDPVYPSDPDGSDENCISMPMVRKADADAVIASQAARIAELEKAHSIAVEIGAQYAADRDALRAELARMREPLSAEALADKCEAWLQLGGATNVVDAFEAGYRECEAHGITKTGG